MTPQQIFNLVKDELQEVEKEFARQSESSVRTISDIGKYLQESGGKRIRPCLLLLCTRLCGRADEAAIKLAAVVEFIHAATLVHDDIIDGAETRRGRVTVNRKWGNQITVLAGDWLYMQSFSVALQQRNFQILDILIDLTQRMVEGELIQLTLNGNRRITEADVLDIARRKTAYLFSGCARIGGVLGRASGEQQAALAHYGLTVGLAFQMVDDILDFSSSAKVLGKPVVSDLKEGKLTLPLVYAIDQCTPQEARQIETVLREREFKTISQTEILSLVAKYQTLEKTRSLARRFAAEAHAALKLFPASPFKQALEDIPQFILEREK
ncbi:MAG: polyprenyl synthetase family protein [Acidobacteria bacterium]|nr:polyprenyl synthetase family protein [Acidobacteriota bacterium]MCI0626118.1 polyprenyl synthetase family protein [Acidobacteriota bacterium]MCI0723560.1 polyprenyl synthetase family protein [Acidobacteriota bacterium]